MPAEQVDIRKDVEDNYECFYDFLDMVSFEVSRYLKPYLPFRNPQGHSLEDPAVLSRDVYNTTEKYFKSRCQLDPKKINYEHFASHFAQTYRETLPNPEGGVGFDTKKIRFIEEDIIDVITDTARKELYN